MSRSAPLLVYTNVIFLEIPSLHLKDTFISRGNLVRGAFLSDETLHTTMLLSVRDIATKANKSEEEKKTCRKRRVDNCPNDNGGIGAAVMGYGTNAAV